MTERARFFMACLALGMAGACQPVAQEKAPSYGGDSALGPRFERAGDLALVPVPLLIALSYQDTRLLPPPAVPSHDGAPPRFGVMALSDGGVRDLARAAALAGQPVDLLRSDDGANILGAALLLGEQAAQELGGLPRDIEGWRPLYRAWSGAPDATTQIGYADAIERLMVEGLRATDAAGRTLILHPVDQQTFQGVTHGPGAGLGEHQLGVDYPGARWVPASTSNYTAGGEAPRYVVIHDMEGSYAGSISWFQNPAAQASAHYLVRSSDGQITQMVSEADIAWHAGNWYYNQHAIGIEHEGYMNAPATWYTEAMYASSARLSGNIADRHGIPKDLSHFIGHYQIPASGSGPPCSGTWQQCDTSAWGGASNHRDPGPGWDWAHYMDLVVSGGVSRPNYDADYHGDSYAMDLQSGEHVMVWLEYTNTGSRTWDTTNTRVGTTMPRDRQSPFYDPANWISAGRPTAADRSTYTTGTVGRFSFTLKAPDVQQTTTFTEHWGLVQEGVTWFGPPDGNVYFQITVHPAGGVGAPPPGSAGLPPPPGGKESSMAGGCQAGRGSAAPGPGALFLVFVLAGAGLRRRRRS